MSRTPVPPAGGRPPAQDSAVALISAYGAFRVLLVLLAAWSFFEGFALFTGSVDALGFGGNDRTAERVIGLQMIGYVPVYVLLAWRREQYRLLIWVPYFAQLAIILPTAFALFSGDADGVLLLIVSLIFFVLLFYFWWHSHPLDFYVEEDEEWDEDADAEDEDDIGPDAAPDAPPGRASSAPPPQRSRESERRFRRRDR